MNNDSSCQPRPPRLLDQVREAIRARHYSPRTAEAYCMWVRRYCVFHKLRHPKEMGGREVGAFLSHLANEEHVAASTQNQALAALLFLYTHVLSCPLGELGELVRAKLPERVPTVLTPDEASSVLERVRGVPGLMAALLYGSGLRLMECARLRIKDVDFERLEIVVRRGKGKKDRVTVFPERMVEPLRAHLVTVREQHVADLAAGAGWVELPDALDRKYPNAGREWPWQWVFPATRTYKHKETGQVRRHHLHETVLAASGAGGGARGGPVEARGLPHDAPFICDASAGRWLRHPYDPGAAGPRGRTDHDAVHARAKSRRARGRVAPRRAAEAAAPVTPISKRLLVNEGMLGSGVGSDF